MIKVIRCLHDLRTLEEEWNLLANTRHNPLLRHEWFLSCAEALHDEASLHVVTLRKNGRLQAIAPLVLAKRHGVHRLELLGASALHEPSGLLYNGTDSLMELCAVITRLPQPTVLQRLAEPSVLAEPLAKQAAGRGRIVTLPASSAPYIEIKSTWESYYNSLSSRRRYDLRHARAKLERTGKVSVEFIRPGEADLERLMQDSLRIESSGWKGRAGSALMFNLSLQRFMLAYTQRACRLGILQLCFLKCNNESIAMQIGIQYADRYWVLKIGYDERWAYCSPGMQLTLEAVRYAFEQRLTAYEFLGADEPWLRVWTQQSHSASTLLYYPYTTRGLSALGIDVLRYAAKRAVRSVSRSG